MKHYKSVECLSNLNVKPPLHKCEQEYSHLKASKRHPSTPYFHNSPQSFSRGTRPYTFPMSTKNVHTSLAYSQAWASEGFLPGGGTWGFFQNFSRGPKVVKFRFFSLETRKTTVFFLKFPNSRGAWPPFRRPCSQDFSKMFWAVNISSVVLRPRRKPRWVLSSFGSIRGMLAYTLSGRLQAKSCRGSWFIHSCLPFSVWGWSILPIFRCPYKTPCHLAHTGQPNHPAF